MKKKKVKSQTEVKLDDDFLEIRVTNVNANKSSVFFLGLMSLIFLAVPFFVIYIKIDLLQPKVFIAFIAMWITALFFGKIILWNLFGSEIYQIKKDEFIYRTDYKYFKGSDVVVEYENLELIFEKDEKISIENAHLLDAEDTFQSTFELKTESKSRQTNIAISNADFNHIQECYNQFLEGNKLQ